MNIIWLSDTELFAAPYSDEMAECARRYVLDMNFTSDDVRIVKRGDQVLVIAKRDLQRERVFSSEQSKTGGS